MSIFRFLQRNTQPSLFQQYQDYLNQAMPDISGIFPNNTTTPDDPTNDPVTDPESGVTRQLLQLTGGGGDNFSVYNPDPTRTRTNYINPFPFNADDNLGFSDYGYPEVPKEGLAGLFETYVKGSPLMQFANKGLRAFGNMLPVNPRGILENELIGKGIMLDDIGRIVTNNYNTPEGIMAGYNAAQMDASTFDDRIANIEKTIARKTAADPNYDPSNLQNRIELIEQAKTNFFDAKDAAGVITDAKRKKKDPTYLTLDEIVAAGLAEGDDDDDDYNFEDYIASISPYQTPTGITSSYPGAVLLNQRNTTRAEDAKRALEASKQREAEAAFAAAGGDRQEQARQRARDRLTRDAANRAFREDPGAKSYSGGFDKSTGNYNDPFDPGGGE